MKAYDTNEFRKDKLIQYNKEGDILVISDNPLNQEIESTFTKSEMSTLIKFLESGNNYSITKISSGFIFDDSKVKIKLVPIEKASLTIPEKENAVSIEINKNDLKNISKFIPIKHQNPVLSGVNICNNHMYATDSFALYKRDFDNEKEINKTIPIEFLKEILSVAKEETITFELTEKRVYVELNGAQYIGPLFQRNYPNVSRMKFENDIHVVYDKQELLDAITYISYMVNPKTVNTVEFKDNTLNFQNENSLMTKLTNKEGGADLQFKCDFYYLEKVIKVIENDEIDISFSNENPVVVAINNTIVLCGVR